MWLWLTVCSAVLLGLYDVCKKQSLKNNGVFQVLLVSTVLNALFLAPFFTHGSLPDHIRLMFKAILVTSSWVTGLVGMKYLPLSTVSTIKASRPMFVVMLSIILFGERLNPWQWLGLGLVIGALYMLGYTSKKEELGQNSTKGFICMAVSVLTGAASALYDKHILKTLEPLFVQSWSNVYIAIVLMVCIMVQFLEGDRNAWKIKWDWYLLMIAVLITAGDALYFFALHDENALLSVVSMVRRSSVVITFLFGALVFKEKNIRDKALSLTILLCGIACLLLSSN